MTVDFETDNEKEFIDFFQRNKKAWYLYDKVFPSEEKIAELFGSSDESVGRKRHEHTTATPKKIVQNQENTE